MHLLGERNVSDDNTLVLMEEVCKSALEENSDDTESGSNYELTKDSNSEESSEDDEEEESLLATAAKTPSSAAKRPSPSARSAPAKRQKNGKSPDPSKRSHHKRKRCPIEGCEFNGADSRRHLKVHVKKGEIEEDSVDGCFRSSGPELPNEHHNRKERARHP